MKFHERVHQMDHIKRLCQRTESKYSSDRISKCEASVYQNEWIFQFLKKTGSFPKNFSSPYILRSTFEIESQFMKTSRASIFTREIIICGKNLTILQENLRELKSGTAGGGFHQTCWLTTLPFDSPNKGTTWRDFLQEFKFSWVQRVGWAGMLSWDGQMQVSQSR